ncbi:MAG: S8 family serine peptidase, partial [Gammaproteobacteria bacterium]|nr:S8 family serine peptidase [Gammaproteobacteria bacterium]
MPAPLTSSAPATLPAPDTAPAPSPPVAQDTDVTEQRIQGHETPDAGDTPALAPVTPPTWTGPGGSLIDRLPPPPQAVGPGPAELTAEPDQILILTPDMLSAQQLEEALNREGARLRTRRALDHLGGVMSVFRLPAHADLAQTLTNWQTAYPDYLIDRNTRYTLQSADRHQYAQHLIVWQAAPTCPPARAIGLIDTPVDITHPALQGADLTQRLFVTRQPADAEHGTAIVSLLVAQPEQGLPGGLLPHARIFSAAAFRRRDQQTETLTEWLLDALNWLLAQQVGVINLSLGGRHNRVLEVALQRVLEKGVVLVAAAGNQGPQAPPVYPAAQPGVIAVTAVDARQR